LFCSFLISRGWPKIQFLCEKKNGTWDEAGEKSYLYFIIIYALVQQENWHSQVTKYLTKQKAQTGTI